MTMKNHHFFVLPSSPWPLVTSIGSFNVFLSLLIFFKFNYFYPFLLNLFLLSLLSFVWWLSYGVEFSLEGKNSFSLENGIKIAMILFISSEVFFFFSFFWSYFHYFLAPSMELGLAWPPMMIQSFDFSNVPLINTLILLSSGVSVTIAHFYLTNKKIFKFLFFLVITSALGILFTILQAQEYTSSFFSLSDSSFGTSFFMLTGFHGLHVIIGTIFLFTCAIRSSFMNQSSGNFLSFELASWYWHFVDVVWIFLYYFLYYFNC